MKKKKLPLWGAIVLVALYLFFGVGNDIPEATEPVIPVESIAMQAPETTNPIEDEAPVTTAPIITEIPETTVPPTTQAPTLDENGTYTKKDDVALYIHIYGKLPNNFITKDEARRLGWEGGGLEDYAPGMCIGGDRFGNYEDLLPDAPGRKWTECDIGTLGRDSRGAKRIVFSNDGLIYYTDDHYESFELLYGEP